MTIMRKLNTDYVVKCFDTWIEDQNKVFIQMEFCSYNLLDLIDMKKRAFNINNNDVIVHSMDYFISTELLKELIESLNYLHKYETPIIHRDIKPENILITNNPNNSRFLKICDFGLIAFQMSHSQHHTTLAGTGGYMAPEVTLSDNTYNSNVDVFSMGIIGQELFYLNL